MNFQVFLKNYLYPVLCFPLLSLGNLYFVTMEFSEAGPKLLLFAILWFALILFFLFSRLVTYFILENSLYRTLLCMASSYFFLGNMFKIMHWPGSSGFYYIAIGLTLPAVAIFIKESIKGNPSKK